MARLAAGLRLAVTTYTVLPVRAPASVDRAVAGTAMLLGPLVGAALGGVLAAEAWLTGHAYAGPHAALLSGAVVVTTLALLTRGMHLDGLADTADGLGSYAGPERALAVMKQPDIGPFGVLAVLLVVVLDVATVAVSLDARHGLAALVVAVASGRLAVTWSCTPRTPAARPGGLGALVAGTTRAGVVAAETAILTLGAAGLGYVAAGHTVPAALRGAAAVVVPLAVAHGIRAHLVRRFGGVTGDVFGALLEVTTAASLLVSAVSWH